MTASRFWQILVAASVASLTAACSTGDLGDIFGQDSRTDRDRYDTVQGEVEYVNTRDKYIEVESDGRALISGLRNEGDSVRLYYDDRVRVEYRNQLYEPAALERGDEIRAEVRRDDNRLWISRIEVTQDVSGSDDRRYTDTIDGVVRYIDTRDYEIEIEQERSRDVYRVRYNPRDEVEYRGRMYPIEGLERGDEVRVELRRDGRDYWLESMVVLRSVSG